MERFKTSNVSNSNGSIKKPADNLSLKLFPATVANTNKIVWSNLHDILSFLTKYRVFKNDFLQKGIALLYPSPTVTFQGELHISASQPYNHSLPIGGPYVIAVSCVSYISRANELKRC